MPKYVIEREIPGAANSPPSNCRRSRKNLAASCVTSALRFNGSTAT